MFRRRPARGRAEARLGNACRTGGGPVQSESEGTAWKSKPSWYVLATKDRTVHPELQRFVAKRMGATIYEVESSHVPMLSKPGFVIDVLRTAAKAVMASRPAG